MERKVIRLTTENELKILMDPVRQRLLRTMEVIGRPVTAKGLADAAGMSAAAAKHHLSRLESIGLVEPDHTEQIHGITAQYYRTVSAADVRLGMEEDDYRTERTIIAENQVMSVFRDFTRSLAAAREAGDMTVLPGDCHTGVAHLTEEQYLRLRESVMAFMRENETAAAGTAPYEFALVYCAAEPRA